MKELKKHPNNSVIIYGCPLVFMQLLSYRGEVKCSVFTRKALVKSRMGSLNFVLQKTLLLSTYLPLNTKEKKRPTLLVSPLLVSPARSSLTSQYADNVVKQNFWKSISKKNQAEQLKNF